MHTYNVSLSLYIYIYSWTTETSKYCTNSFLESCRLYSYFLGEAKSLFSIRAQCWQQMGGSIPNVGDPNPHFVGLIWLIFQFVLMKSSVFAIQWSRALGPQKNIQKNKRIWVTGEILIVIVHKHGQKKGLWGTVIPCYNGTLYIGQL